MGQYGAGIQYHHLPKVYIQVVPWEICCHSWPALVDWFKANVTYLEF
jgi:hypothetical protein